VWIGLTASKKPLFLSKQWFTLWNRRVPASAPIHTSVSVQLFMFAMCLLLGGGGDKRTTCVHHLSIGGGS
jgi:hypothetical protein